MTDRTKDKTLSLRLSDRHAEMLDGAVSIGSFKVSKTSIVERGIELAVQELDITAKVLASLEYRPCVECGEKMTIGPGHGRANKQFCGAACQMRAHRRKKKGEEAE